MLNMGSYDSFTIISIFSLVLGVFVRASPFPQPVVELRTTEPTFPATPASCPICSANYASIQNCAEASPVLANFSEIIFNPGAFISVIQCSCTETFQSVFPQCVDCFEQTNQTDVLATPDLGTVLQGMRNICALESTLLGSAAATDGELPSSTASAAATVTAASNSQPKDVVLSLPWIYLSSAVVGFIGLGHLLL
ncbi:hypothetical protein BDP27DRAFT_1316986 [Rhodocollybia butyracea]|uniref:Uncharacterized protein n=1 Tax=Rhodocollybia butyracea TaxID=206335 RepID=A0A9P5PXH6_9AGAR|nr:hypothetical protein BDP27DRAFT_1316986 [Rhodocollybia butyracea]